MEFTPENKRKFDEIVERYPVKRSALLPALSLAQEQFGYLSREALEYVAKLLDLTPAQVHDTASYYAMYRFQPEGRTLLEFCTTLSCSLGGAEGLLQSTCRKLAIAEGGTSADGKFTVKRVECLAACGGAPAVQVDGAWLEGATEGDIDRVLAGETLRRPFVWPKSPGEHILFRNVWKKDSQALATYQAGGGYANLKKYLSMKPEDIIETVKRSNLRGRGGAGFPTGLKWSFLPKENPKPRYLCVNADESEPGTYKDRVIIEQDPHQLIESTVVSCHAIRSRTAYIYIRGEFHEGARNLEKALQEARAAGYVGRNILGTGVDVEVHVHRGAGAYECGEETALLESLEGKRGQPRMKPPFPANVGLYGCPTIVNNVETL
ncbi:MAG TPA: NAD(P)H-dependent oxidoreductase subunit E, partial [Vicinamibacteria bacterium]|nr:NAD(P)H-dependent oxidoreductase subunit E [Vicinamibacteria bacterium]